MKVEVIMLESHLFFKSYPRSSWWRSHNRDDLPLRTIKTLVYLCKSLRQCEASDKAGAAREKCFKEAAAAAKAEQQLGEHFSSSNVMGDTGGSPSVAQVDAEQWLAGSRRTMTHGANSKRHHRQQPSLPRTHRLTFRCRPLVN
ncbi:hypothetical protein TYRP_021524 [Tyrophagus putrescentiae]|nr:hypothetical protein TYRP_021524 [Tyrophagus putrescentiae]